MGDATPFTPDIVFGGDAGARLRAMIAPARYVQGPGVLDHLGRYLSPLGVRRVALLMSRGGASRFGDGIRAGLGEAGIDVVEAMFEGESSVPEVTRLVEGLSDVTVDGVVAVGGGKCIDAAKMVAHRLAVPVAVCPSLASTDAPCSALSVVYSPEGVVSHVEYFPHSPALVAIDTRVVADAPTRYLVAGMGDALATWYEARACARNPRARSVLGARPTLTAGAIGELCAKTLYADGAAAAAATDRNEVTGALDRVVEANTLMSGIGFESGGIAAAHCIASGLTTIERVRTDYMHGEMVAFGLLAQLVLEGAIDEARRAASFCASVGLPVRFADLSLSGANDADDAVAAVAEAAMATPFIHNEPVPVDADALLLAMRGADALGADVVASAGDTAYRMLHSKASPVA